MPRKDLFIPLLILVVGLVCTATVLARAEQIPIGRSQGYTAPTQTAQTGGYPAPTTAARAPGQPTPGALPTSQTQVTTTVTLSVPPTLAPTLTPTLPLAVQAPTAPATPTPTFALVGDVVCNPGVQLSIAGTGPPRAPIMLYFGQRIVGGGSIEADGSFTLPLVVGSERAGSYPVSVRVRGSGQVLTQFTCSVPPVTPTPVPGRRLFP